MNARRLLLSTVRKRAAVGLPKPWAACGLAREPADIASMPAHHGSPPRNLTHTGGGRVNSRGPFEIKGPAALLQWPQRKCCSLHVLGVYTTCTAYSGRAGSAPPPKTAGRLPAKPNPAPFPTAACGRWGTHTSHSRPPPASSARMVSGNTPPPVKRPTRMLRAQTYGPLRVTHSLPPVRRSRGRSPRAGLGPGRWRRGRRGP